MFRITPKFLLMVTVMKEAATIKICISNYQTSNFASTSSFEANALILTLLSCEMGIITIPNSGEGSVLDFPCSDKIPEGNQLEREKVY